MSAPKKTSFQTDPAYWTERYLAKKTGWDIGYPSPPLTAYADQLARKDLEILIPGSGNAYEAEYLWRAGFGRTHVLDISPAPLRAFAQRVPDFPPAQLLNEDFFTHTGQYDLILEQTFFCAFPPTPENRRAYAQRVHDLLRPGGKLVGLWFDLPEIGTPGQPPHGGSRAEYLGYFEPLFTVRTFETARNSIPPRQGNELFGIFEKPAAG
jgi:methyl halide transferase